MNYEDRDTYGMHNGNILGGVGGPDVRHGLGPNLMGAERCHAKKSTYDNEIIYYRSDGGWLPSWQPAALYKYFRHGRNEA